MMDDTPLDLYRVASSLSSWTSTVVSLRKIETRMKLPKAAVAGAGAGAGAANATPAA